MTWLLVAAALSFGAGFLLEEGAVWFARGAVRAGDAAESALGLVSRARASRLAAGLCFACGAMSLVGAAGAGLPVWVAALGGVLFVAAVTGLVAAEWGSPLQMVGRVILPPFRPVARFAEAVLPGSGAATDGESTEIDAETGWLAGASPDRDAGEALATVREFRESRVEDVLVPRAEVSGLPVDATVGDALARVRKDGFSRYPVYRESLDTVTGILHVFDLLGADPAQPVAPLAREPFLTSETKPVTSLLRELQVSYNQMAVVLDEFGGTAGVVTVEDLLEELVGEIRDETDEEEADIVLVEPGVYRVSAGVRIDDLNESLDLDLPEGEYDTIAGMVLERLERIPKTGERLTEDDYLLEVTASEPHRIHTLQLTLTDRSNRREGRGARNGDPR